MNTNSWFRDRVAVLATMHQKEKAIAPLFETELGCKVIVPTQFDSDRFGTFTRDIKRLGTQIEAARNKAQNVLEVTGETLAIASEGSFYPHPSFPFLACDREIVLLLDIDNDLEVIGEEISTQTNYNHQKIKNLQEALDFAQKVGFPEHGLVVMISQDATERENIFKGIVDEKNLIEMVEIALKKSPNGTIHLETDMRAMYNPTRLKVIEKATYNLIKKLNCFCPQCGVPGFDIIERLAGLPCGWCSTPTALIKTAIYQCQKCDSRQEKLFPDGRETADPSQCQYCNP
jgi:Zn finger protein HypA/HybF involved in hydrogenase expression